MPAVRTKDRVRLAGCRGVLLDLLHDAAAGRFPPMDNRTLTVPAPQGAAAAVLSFAAHHVVAADVPAPEVDARLEPRDFNGPLGIGFLAWLAERTGTVPGSVDVVLARTEPATGPPLPDLHAEDHARVRRARAHRDDVRVLGDERGVVVLGRGLAGRQELSMEVHESARARSAARALIVAALATARPAEPVFAQCAAANAASLRALAAAGFRPIGAEVLFSRRTAPAAE
jgi:GNAT superfamily N-acetyltransferase